MMSPAIPKAPEPIVAKAAGPGRPKDPGKRAAILDAAKRMFVAQGFDGISMDQIAAEAGVSKLTVYSHFGDKDTLFAEAVRAHCEQGMPTTLFVAEPDTPIRERLLAIGNAFFSMIMTPEAIAGHRILCSPQVATSTLPRLNGLLQELTITSRQLSDLLDEIDNSPQLLLLGRGKPVPGPGEAGFRQPGH